MAGRASGKGAACPYPHLPEGHYAAAIGTIPVDAQQWERTASLALNSQAAIDKAVKDERTAQTEARADLTQAITDQHQTTVEHLNAALKDARDELRDREGRLRSLLTALEADIAKIMAAEHKAAIAEHRDKGLEVENDKHERSTQLGALQTRLNAELTLHGINEASRLIGPALPLLAAKAGGNAPPPSQKDLLESDPPPVAMAIVHFFWRQRDMDILVRLSRVVLGMAALPQLQELGAAMRQQAPTEFAALSAALVQAAQPQQPQPNGNAPAAQTPTTT